MLSIKCKMTALWTIFCLFTISCAFGQRHGAPHKLWIPINFAELNQSVSKSDIDSASQYFKTQILEDSGSDVTDRASRALQNGLVDSDSRYDIRSACLNHTEQFLTDLVSGQMWAIRMIDAMGKPSSAILQGDFNWLGSYDECVGIQAYVNISGKIRSSYKGRYCTSSLKIDIPLISQQLQGYMPELKIGVCLPDSCNNEDTASLIRTLLSLIPVNTTLLPDPEVDCQMDFEYDTRAILALVICSLFALVMTVATAYDVILQNFLNTDTKIAPNEMKNRSNLYIVTKGTDEKQPVNGQALPNGTSDANGHVTKLDVELAENSRNHEPGTLGKALLSFSIYTNAAKILNTSQPSGTLTAVNGIRFISMSWVILGHTVAFVLGTTENVAAYYVEATQRFTYQPILNGTFSVDTFFTLSGLLVAYLSLKEMKKMGGAMKLKWGMFYFHRFWRLTPPYMLFMMFYVCLMRYWYNGPMWPVENDLGKTCGDYWWRNLLYINNFFKASEACMGHSWYLSNDMQFYVLSPLMLVPLYYSKVTGVLACSAFLFTSWLASGIISSRDHLSANQMFDRTGKQFDNLYDKPWTRIGPYVVGLLAGYILYKTNCKIRMPKVINLFGWLVATTLALLVLYGLHDPSGQPHLSKSVTAFYNATSRSVWGLAVAWVVVACATGHGGFVNTLLSWKALIPLSRLTYCAYLVHPIVMYFYYQSRRTLIYMTDLEVAYLFCGHLCLSYAVAFITSLAFESPMMGLEKALLGRGKRS